MFETFSWEHGVAVGACVKSEATAAAEHTGKNIDVTASQVVPRVPDKG